MTDLDKSEEANAKDPEVSRPDKQPPGEDAAGGPEPAPNLPPGRSGDGGAER